MSDCVITPSYYILFIYLFIYLFIQIAYYTQFKQLQYKSMQTYKKKHTKKTQT